MTQQQEKNLQISGGPLKTTGETASTLPQLTPIVDFFEKEESKKNGYLQRDGSTQDPQSKASGTHRNIQKRTQKPYAKESWGSCQRTYLEHLVSPGISLLNCSWGKGQIGQARGLACPIHYHSVRNHPKIFSDSQKYIFLLLWHDSLREDRWPGSKNMGHATQIHSTGMQPHPSKSFLHNIPLIVRPPVFNPHHHGCILLHTNTRTSNSEAIASFFPRLTDVRHILEPVASFYHQLFSIGNAGISYVLECTLPKTKTTLYIILYNIKCITYLLLLLPKNKNKPLFYKNTIVS